MPASPQLVQPLPDPPQAKSQPTFRALLVEADQESARTIESLATQSEEFFRLISENVTDLIAVVDAQGRRLYNNPAYERSLGKVNGLQGSDSFHEIHPDDRDRIRQIFSDTLSTGVGQRAEYRMLLHDGSIRHIESLGSVIRDNNGQPAKVVVVSRDITERKQAMDRMEQTLAELRQAHQDLKAAQSQLVQSEKIEALSTFAAAITHEVRNPLQTMLLGVDFLRQIQDSSNHPDPTVTTVLNDLENGARRADAVIQGLLEFTSYRHQNVGNNNLSQLVARALRAVESEFTARSILLTSELEADLPPIRVDGRKIRHVLIKLFLGSAERLRSGGTLRVRTSLRLASSLPDMAISTSNRFSPSDSLVAAEIEQSPARKESAGSDDEFSTALLRQGELDLLVLKKVVEMYGGIIHSNQPGQRGFSHVLLLFPHSPQPNP